MQEDVAQAIITNVETSAPETIENTELPVSDRYMAQEKVGF